MCVCILNSCHSCGKEQTDSLMTPKYTKVIAGTLEVNNAFYEPKCDAESGLDLTGCFISVTPLQTHHGRRFLHSQWEIVQVLVYLLF